MTCLMPDLFALAIFLHLFNFDNLLMYGFCVRQLSFLKFEEPHDQKTAGKIDCDVLAPRPDKLFLMRKRTLVF